MVIGVSSDLKMFLMSMLVIYVFEAYLTAILGTIFNISIFWIKTMFHFNCLYHLAS